MITTPASLLLRRGDAVHSLSSSFLNPNTHAYSFQRLLEASAAAQIHADCKQHLHLQGLEEIAAFLLASSRKEEEVSLLSAYLGQSSLADLFPQILAARNSFWISSNKMNDLLGDSVHTRVENGKGASHTVDLEMGAAGSSDPSKDPAMAQFFEEVAVIKNLMAQVRKHLQQLQGAHEESKSVTQAAAMKALKQRMEANVDEVSTMARNIKDKLEALDKANLQNRKKPGAAEGTSIDRIRVSVTITLKKKLKELMDEFQTLRQKIHSEYREVVERRVFTVTGKKLDEETIDRLIETGDSEQIFHKAIQEQGRGQILDTLDEIQQRHDAVKDIERKLLDLHQIFLDMAVLVDEQGELLDNIETQVSNAVEHVQDGTKLLQRAKSLQKNSRKWMCIAIIILLLIIVIIVVAVLQPWKTKQA